MTNNYGDQMSGPRLFKHISNYAYIFLLKKCEKLLQCKSFSHFSTKNIGVFVCKVVKHLMT